MIQIRNARQSGQCMGDPFNDGFSPAEFLCARRIVTLEELAADAVALSHEIKITPAENLDDESRCDASTALQRVCPKNEMSEPVAHSHSAPPFRPMAVDIIEAAKLVGVSDDTIRREIDRGKLKGVKIGRVWRVRISELEAYLRRCEVRQ